MNSISYVQKQIDKILRKIKDFIQTYVNDIICDLISLIEYLFYLRQLFILFIKFNVFINLKKTFLRFLNVNLLDQKINSLNLITFEEKLKIINLLRYSQTLDDLKHYLRLIEYFR